MRLELFKTISSSPAVATAGSVLFCVVALAAGIWSSVDDHDSVMFMLDGYNEQFGWHENNDDTFCYNFTGRGV